jgi:hypothetical protein
MVVAFIGFDRMPSREHLAGFGEIQSPLIEGPPALYTVERDFHELV